MVAEAVRAMSKITKPVVECVRCGHRASPLARAAGLAGKVLVCSRCGQRQRRLPLFLWLFISAPVNWPLQEEEMRLEEHFESRSTLQRNERVKLAASFWNNVGAGMVIGGMAGAFFLDKPPGAWAKIGIAIAGLVLGWLCYSLASNMLTYLHTAPEDRRRAN